MERIHLKIHGMVQGVFFRSHTRDIATQLKIHGIVRNMPDGDVEVIAEGDRGALEKLLEWCRRGPSTARVDAVDISWEEPRETYGDFRIAC